MTILTKLPLSSEISWRVKNRYISENVNVEILETPNVKIEDKIVKVANEKFSKENIKNVPKVKKENVKNVQIRRNYVLTYKQKQYLRTEKYKKQLRRNRVNQSSRNCYNCHCHNTCCSMSSNFQGNQIAHSQGKRSTNVQQKERISKSKHNPMDDEVQKQEIPNQKMKPQVPKLHKEKVFKNVLETNDISKISDFNEQKKMFTSLWVQSNMIFHNQNRNLKNQNKCGFLKISSFADVTR